MAVISPPDRLIKQVEVNKGALPGKYSVKGFGPGRVPLVTFRGADAVTFEGSTCDGEISGYKWNIILEPIAGLNCLEILEGEAEGRKTLHIRGTHKILV